MCGRYVDPDEAAIERLWHIGRHNWAPFDPPRYNVAPTMQVPVILMAEDGETELLGARWGLIPHWWSKPQLPALTFNARSEEAAGKPMWRESLAGRRCLMPARGWYEWNEQQQARNAAGKVTNQPYFLYCPDAPVVAFAGLWSIWTRDTETSVLSCALLSKEAAPSIASIHHRMPVVLHPEQFAAWLDPATEPNEVQLIIQGARTDLAGHPVSTKVNSVRNDSPKLVERIVAEPALF